MAYTSEFDAYAWQTHQIQTRLFSGGIRFWHVCSANASVSYLYAQHKHKNSKFEKVPSKHAEHMCPNSICMLSILVRN